MPDLQSLLLILQVGSMTVTMTLFLILVLSYFQKPDTTRAYEQVRWLMAFSMLLFAIHYGLQIIFGFRAQGDDVGAVINILFYSPLSYTLSYSMVRIGCGTGYHQRYLVASLVSMLLILGCFVCGYLYYGSLHIHGFLHAMGLLYFITMATMIVYPIKEIRRVSKKLDEESGQEPVQYNLYMRTCTTLLDITAFLTPFCIFHTLALVVVGPLFFVALVFYVICFIALGFNIRQVKGIIEESEQEIESIGTESSDEEASTSVGAGLREEIRNRLELWRLNQGYAASETNSNSLAVRLNVPRRCLVQYLREVEGKTFRVWLSDLRLEEAKRLICEHPEYSNETIAETCGFSRSHFQTKFKESTGLTINEWRERG